MHAIASIILTALFLVLAPPARAADRFVSTLGSDAGNDCLVSTSPCLTVGQGLAQAASSDTVKIAAGRYKENVVLSTATTLIVSGGWSEDFSTQDPEATPTVLRAAAALPVVTVVAHGIAIDLTADGLTIEKGKNFSGSGAYCDEVAGGGMCASVYSGGNLTLSFSRMVFRKNKAEASGGGFDADVFDVGSSLNMTVTDSTFEKNKARFGGGFYIYTDQTPAVDAVLDGVHFFRNVGGVGGGFGVGQAFLPTGQNAQVLIQNSVFEKNKVAKKFAGGPQGGGLFAVNTGCDMSGCPVTVENTVFVKNRAVSGGGIMVGGGIELVNVTVTRNTARGPGSDGGGGVNTEGGTIRNSVIWGNRGDGVRDLRTDPFQVDLEYSDVGERTDVNDLGGNINADPLFARISKGDVHLLAGSPAIDTGTCSDVPPTDYEGDPRPTGPGCDMGADEFVP